MNRLEKKCLLASTGMHAVLLLLILFGTAFYVPGKKKPVDIGRMKVVPTRLIDQAISGGGGNPKLPPSDEMQKGNPLVQPRPTPQPPPPIPPPRTPPPLDTPPPEATKAEPAPSSKKAPSATAKNPVRDSTKSTSKNPSRDLAGVSLKPVIRSNTDKEAARAEAEARDWASRSQRIAKRLGGAVESLRSGFEQGTVVEASGPGGEAYMDYAAWVKQVYEDAWIVTDTGIDDNATTKANVTIARNGRVISAIIERRSGDAALDRSVERALERVRSVGHPFPEGAREDQRVFKINFNLKAKRLTG